MAFDPRWNVQRTAQEISRMAIEGIGWSAYQHMRATFAELVQAKSADPQVQIHVVGRALQKAIDPDTGPKDEADRQLAGYCLLWLADTEMRDWNILQLIAWTLQFQPKGE